jgi:lambda family phage portal protein
MKSAASRRQSMLPGLDSSGVPRARADSTDFASGAAPSNQGASLYSRDLRTWRPPLRSADGDLLYDKRNLVTRSRDLERNSGIAKGGIQTLVDNVVGSGLRLNPQPNYLVLGQTKAWADEWSRGVRAQWLTWADTTACDAADTQIFDQMTALQFRSNLVSGDAAALPLWFPDSPDGWATKIQTIDADRLSTPAGMMESQRLRGGVEMNEYGAPIAYQVRAVHPGDYLLSGADAGKAFTWVRIPKYTSFGRRTFIHCFDKERSGQTRGRPIMASILTNFKGLDRYTQAEIQAAVVNAMVAMVIETPLDQEGIEALFKDDRDAYLAARRDHAVAIESGSMLPLFPGDKATSFTPSRPSSAFGAFQENVGRIIALGYDIPYELLFKDFTKANYSSMRAAMLEAWRSFNRRRDDLSTQWCDPIYALWLEEAINAGKVEAPGFYENRAAYTRCKWIGPGRGWVDPLKEAAAADVRLNSRVSTLEKECAEQGEDWRDVLDQVAVENEYKRRLGIPEVVVGRATVVPDDTSQASGVETPGSAPASDKPNQDGASGSATYSNRNITIEV